MSELEEFSDFIVGVQINQIYDDKEHEYAIHQIIKGNNAPTAIQSQFLRLNPHEYIVYALVFLYRGELGHIVPVNAMNDVLLFNTMEDANYAIQRFRELIAIRKETNRITQEKKLLEWLIQSIEIGQQDGINSDYYWYSYDAYASVLKKHDWFYDVQLEFQRAWFNDVHNTDKFKLFEHISVSQKERIFKVFRQTKTPSRTLLAIVQYLDIEAIKQQLFTATYELLAIQEEYYIDDHIEAYVQALKKCTLSYNEQEYLAKLLLFYYKYEHHLSVKNIDFIIQFLDQSAVSAAYQTWSDEFNPRHVKREPDYKQLTPFFLEAEKHLNMCDDWRISKLTGKRKLWTCTEESAFAKAKAFDKEQIDVQLFPNPSNGNFNIKLKLENNAPVFVEVLTLAGKSIAKQKLAAEKGLQFHFKGKFELEGLVSGIYFIQVRQKNRLYMQKIVVE